VIVSAFLSTSSEWSKLMMSVVSCWVTSVPAMDKATLVLRAGDPPIVCRRLF